MMAGGHGGGATRKSVGLFDLDRKAWVEGVGGLPSRIRYGSSRMLFMQVVVVLSLLLLLLLSLLLLLLSLSLLLLFVALPPSWRKLKVVEAHSVLSPPHPPQKKHQVPSSVSKSTFLVVNLACTYIHSQEERNSLSLKI